MPQTEKSSVFNSEALTLSLSKCANEAVQSVSEKRNKDTVKNYLMKQLSDKYKKSKMLNKVYSRRDTEWNIPVSLL